MKSLMKTAIVFCLVGALGCALAGCGGSRSSDSSTDNPSNAASDGDAAADQAASTGEAGYDSPIEFDDLTIVVGSEITTETLENQYSDLNGQTIIAFPISVTNNKDETHGLNMFYISAYGPNGTQLDEVSTYFSENDISFAGEARTGATLQSYVHVPYDGDGDYYLEFKNFSEKVELKLPVSLGL